MSAKSKMIAVIVRSREPRRIAEALRGAVGLTLRGDRVRVALAPDVPRTGDRDVVRAIATLTSFGHPVSHDDGAIAAALAEADAVEVWS
jgi:hypothetical protein